MWTAGFGYGSLRFQLKRRFERYFILSTSVSHSNETWYQIKSFLHHQLLLLIRICFSGLACMLNNKVCKLL